MSRPAACAGRSGGAAKCRSNARHYAAWLDSATPAGGWLHMGRSTLETRCGRGDSATVRIVGKVLFSAPLSGRSRGACAARGCAERRSADEELDRWVLRGSRGGWALEYPADASDALA